MIIKKITYTDYDGNERTEEFFFNLSKAETLEMEMEIDGGMGKMLTKIVETHDQPKLVKMFKQIILKAYGEKSADGKRFIKSPSLSEAFSQTEAYSELFMELATNEEAATAFVKGILPADTTQPK